MAQIPNVLTHYFQPILWFWQLNSIRKLIFLKLNNLMCWSRNHHYLWQYVFFLQNTQKIIWIHLGCLLYNQKETIIMNGNICISKYSQIIWVPLVGSLQTSQLFWSNQLLEHLGIRTLLFISSKFGLKKCYSKTNSVAQQDWSFIDFNQQEG